MRKALSDKAILAFKPKQGLYEVFDALCPGLGLRVDEQHAVEAVQSALPVRSPEYRDVAKRIRG